MTLSATATLDVDSVELPPRVDEFTREIYGLLGIPIDVTSMRTVVHRIEDAAAHARPLLISTANVNYLATSRTDSEFRQSLLSSDLCTADGMPIVWLSRLLGIPMKDRVAGSDLFDVLKCLPSGKPLKVFLFGGAHGVAEKAAEKLNSQNGGVVCAGALFPGYCSLDEMSTDGIIDTINSSNADFLAVALGAQKGQLWLQRNHDRLTIPIRAHLGATINFQAGVTRRAPLWLRKHGLEWVWRIKEEPWLWRRYLADSAVLMQIVVTRVIPLLVLRQWQRLRWSHHTDIQIERRENRDYVTLDMTGSAITRNLDTAAPYFRHATIAAKHVVINCKGVRQVDARFIGSLLVLDQRLKRQGRHLFLKQVPRTIDWLIRLHGFGYLL